MSSDNVVELGAHTPSVESILTRLQIHQDRIKNIVVFVEYDEEDGGSSIGHNTMPDEDLAYALGAINYVITKTIYGKLERD